MELTMPPQKGEDIITAALKVLQQPDPHKKAEFTNIAVELWRNGELAEVDASALLRVPPERPARSDEKVKLVAPKDLPRRGKAGSLVSRQALLHSLVHIENWATDLAWDIIARFGQDPTYRLPRAFFDDFVAVAEDECRHFQLLEQRLEETGGHYGMMPAHDGLWVSATETSGNLAARLAVEHCTHEARGLDVLPQTIHRFRSNGDEASAALLENVIYKEEISHCQAGVRWIRHLHGVAHAWKPQQAQQGIDGACVRDEAPPCDGCGSSVTGACAATAGAATAVEGNEGGGGDEGGGGGGGEVGMPQWVAEARRHPRVEEWFHELVRGHFRGPLKPPFNKEARAKAGFGPEWYLPLAEAEEEH